MSKRRNHIGKPKLKKNMKKTMEDLKNNSLEDQAVVVLETHEVNIRDHDQTSKIAYLIHFLLGIGNLLPWNALITAVDYFSYLYPTKHVEKAFSVAYMSSSVLVLVIMMSWPDGWRRKKKKGLSFRFRMNLGFCLFIVSLMVTLIVEWAWKIRLGPNNNRNQRSVNGGGYGVIVGAIVLCGLGDGLVGGSLIGSAGKLPKQYMQAVFAGTASSGVLVSMLRMITKACLPQNPKGLQTSAHFYFIVAITILILCTFSCNFLTKLPQIQVQNTIIINEIQYPLITPNPKFWTVAAKIKPSVFSIFITYVVTLSIFPGFIAEELESKLLQDWYPILLITIYNVADLVGKSLTAVYVMKSVSRAVWLCVARVLFYPLYIGCLHGPVWLKTEIPVVSLTFLLGLTNGYLTSVLMICTPKLVPSPEAELSAIVMVVFLGFGLVGGSVLGWFWII